MGTFSRLRYVVAANVNALIEKAEDPEKLLRALIREMEDAGEEARAASAELLAEQQRLERFAIQLAEDVAQWQKRAEEAVARDRDDLARAALKARTEIEAQHAAALDEQKHCGERVAQMEQDMQTLKAKLADAKRKLKGMQSGKAPKQVNAEAAAAATPGERKVRRAMDRFDRLQAQVDNLEARVRSYDVGGPAAEVWNENPAETADPAIETELEELKARLAAKPQESAQA
ncbi:MAG: PspA/IM30 family protein [Xanthomonadales bacterium]|nr:PspA/IM30 family protein [Xanthomonadales bacterium]